MYIHNVRLANIIFREHRQPEHFPEVAVAPFSRKEWLEVSFASALNQLLGRGQSDTSFIVSDGLVRLQSTKNLG